MSGRPDILDQVAFALTAALIGAVLFLAGVWVGTARGGSSHEPGAHAEPVPDWFLPIADAYDRNPKITPTFDFASLYDMQPESYGVAARTKELRAR
jgi:hypothetical protein